MKFTAKTSDLIKCASLAQRATKSKTTMMALSSLLVEPTTSSVKITGSDMACSVSAWCPADVFEPEAFAIPARRLIHLLSNCSAESVGIETVLGSVRITLGQAESVISTLSPDEFPKSLVCEGKTLVFDGKVLSETISKLTPFLLRESGADINVTQNLFLTGKDGKLTFHACNNKCFVSIWFDSDEKGDAIIPPKTASMIGLCAWSSPGKVSLTIGERTVKMVGENCSVTGVLAEGPYPDIDHYVPTDPTSIVTVDREALLSSIQCAAPFSVDGFFGIIVKFGDGMEISTRAPENHYREHLFAGYSAPCDLTLGFNHENLIAGLSRMTGTTVNIQVKDKISPVVIQEGNFRYVTTLLNNL